MGKITKYGQIIITEKEIKVRCFTFDGENENYNESPLSPMDDLQKQACEWGINRLQDELKKIKENL